MLACEQKRGNSNDPYAVVIKKGSEVVRHVPRKSAAARSLFLLLVSKELELVGFSCYVRHFNKAML